MKKKVIVLLSLTVLIVSIFLLIGYTHRWVWHTDKWEYPIGVFIGEKSDIEEVKLAILTYIGDNAKHMSESPNTSSKESLEKFLNEELPFMKDYIIGVEIEGNTAFATLGSDIPLATRFYKLSKKNGKWSIEKCLYLAQLKEKEKAVLFKKLDEISGKLVNLEPDRVVYQFLSTNFGINDSGVATIEERNETECKVKVPLKDGRVVQFILVRGAPDTYLIRPWEVKECKFIKPKIRPKTLLYFPLKRLRSPWQVLQKFFQKLPFN